LCAWLVAIRPLAKYLIATLSLRQKRQIEQKLGSLVVPELESVQQAAKLLEDLPQLWEEANLGERWKTLQAMLEGVYVDTVEEKAVIALKPKPAFRGLFQIATTKEGSRVVLYNEKALTFSESPDDLCSWWRRGRVELLPDTYLRRPAPATELMAVGMLAA
jgi:hypothetical protein